MHASNIVQMGCRRIDFISKFLELLWLNTISMLEGKILLLLASIKGSFCRPRQMTPFRQICSEKFLQVLLQDISKLQTFA